MRWFMLQSIALIMAATAAAGQPLTLKLKDLEGNKTSLASILAKGPAVISFWATWCHPCQEELVQLQRLQQTYGDSGVIFVAISIDDAKTTGKVKALTRGKKFTFLVLLDQEQQAMNAFGLNDVPGVFILKTDGAACFEHRGYKPGDEDIIERAVKDVIPRPQCLPDSGGAGPQ